MECKLLKAGDLGKWFEAFRSGGRRVLAPSDRDGLKEFTEVQSPADWASKYVQTRMSPKSAVFPRCEKLLQYSDGPKGPKVEACEPSPPRTVVFGARPCEAAGFAVQRAVFTWDSGDAQYEARDASTAVVGVSCREADSRCFCTSVGGGPGDTRGSDVLLTPLPDGSYLAEILTEKGAELVCLSPGIFAAAPGGTDKSACLAKVPVRFSLDGLKGKLPARFDDEVWDDMALRCLGCGACAYVCPACTCFDVQDEKGGAGGRRLRGWDSCGFALFTLHASGHNPREVQGERWRQRIMHKFVYQPDRQGVLGCLGCGKCSRACPVDMDIAEHLETLAEERP